MEGTKGRGRVYKLVVGQMAEESAHGPAHHSHSHVLNCLVATQCPGQWVHLVGAQNIS